MALNLITLNTVKTNLGITTSTGDASITAMIPVVSADVRRILNTDYKNYATCSVTIGSDQVIIYGVYNAQGYFSYDSPLVEGTVIQCDAFAADTYITDYDVTTGYYTMSSVAIAQATHLYPTVTLGMQMAISKMIWYKISKQTTVGIDKERGISSESYGPISISFSTADTNNKWNYPSNLISDLGTPFTSVG